MFHNLTTKGGQKMNDNLKVRLRHRLDRDIKQGIEWLKPLEQGELSELIRDGMRLVLKERGILADDGNTQNPKDRSWDNHCGNG